MTIILQVDQKKRPHVAVDGELEAVRLHPQSDDPEMGRWIDGMALYQDAEGKIPVTAIGQAIGRIVVKQYDKLPEDE